MKITNIEEALSLATEHQRAGRFDKAERLYRDILTSDAANADALRLLGVLEFQTGRFAEAADHIQRSLDRAEQIAPNLRAACLSLLGEIYSADRKFEDAVRAFRAALAIRSDDPACFTNLAGALRRLGRTDEAIDCYHRALLLDPTLAAAHNNLGNLLRERHKLDEAIRSYRTALARDPRLADTWLNLGLALKEVGRVGEAIEAFRRGLAQNRDHAVLHAATYLALTQTCTWAEARSEGLLLDQMLAEDLGHRVPVREMPYLNLVRVADAAQNRAVAESHCAAIAREVADLAGTGPRPPSGRGPRLRLGYLFNDRHRHQIKRLLMQFLDLHDRGQFEILLYPYADGDHSHLRQRIRERSDGFRDLSRLPLPEAAASVRADAPDILIDLTPHLPGSRMDLLALRLAPVQAVHYGWPATTGAAFVDFIMADPVVIPDEHRDRFTEQPIWLPTYFMPEPTTALQDAAACDRRTAGLPESGFVFSAFVPPEEMDERLFASWLRILAAVPDSVLWLPRCNGGARTNLRAAAGAARVAPDRLIFAARVPSKAEHVARGGLADIALDSREINTPVATIDALRAGVPVITTLGDRYASRSSASILQAVGVPELIAGDAADYETLAITLALGPPGLAGMRRRVQEGARALWSPASEQRWMRCFEDALRGMVAAKEDARSAAV